MKSWAKQTFAQPSLFNEDHTTVLPDRAKGMETQTALHPPQTLPTPLRHMQRLTVTLRLLRVQGAFSLFWFTSHYDVHTPAVKTGPIWACCASQQIASPQKVWLIPLMETCPLCPCSRIPLNWLAISCIIDFFGNLSLTYSAKPGFC